MQIIRKLRALTHLVIKMISADLLANQTWNWLIDTVLHCNDLFSSQKKSEGTQDTDRKPPLFALHANRYSI